MFSRHPSRGGTAPDAPWGEPVVGLDMASLQKKPGLTGPMQAVANGAPPPPIQNTARRMLNGGRSARDPILDMSLDSHSWSPIWSTGHIAKQHSFSHLERQSVHTWTRNDRFRHMTTHAKEYQPIEKRADDSVHRKEPKQLICSKCVERRIMP